MARAFPSAILERSTIDTRDGELKLRIKTEDLGFDNAGGVRVFDAHGKKVDIPLEFSHKHGNADVFARNVASEALRANGFDLATLEATAYVDVPGVGRLWEEKNHTVVRQIRDAAVSVGFSPQRAYSKASAQTASGLLRAELFSQPGAMSGSHTASRDVAVAELRFEDTTGFFGGVDRLEVEITPEHTVRKYTADGEEALPGVEDFSKMAVVTLHRQADGAYASSLSGGDALFVTSSETGMAADTLEAIRVAVRDPATGKIDPAFGQRPPLVGG